MLHWNQSTLAERNLFTHGKLYFRPMYDHYADRLWRSNFTYDCLIFPVNKRLPLYRSSSGNVEQFRITVRKAEALSVRGQRGLLVSTNVIKHLTVPNVQLCKYLIKLKKENISYNFNLNHTIEPPYSVGTMLLYWRCVAIHMSRAKSQKAYCKLFKNY